jgi:hypothetical protein
MPVTSRPAADSECEASLDRGAVDLTFAFAYSRRLALWPRARCLPSGDIRVFSKVRCAWPRHGSGAGRIALGGRMKLNTMDSVSEGRETARSSCTRAGGHYQLADELLH